MSTSFEIPVECSRELELPPSLDIFMNGTIRSLYNKDSFNLYSDNSNDPSSSNHSHSISSHDSELRVSSSRMTNLFGTHKFSKTHSQFVLNIEETYIDIIFKKKDANLLIQAFLLESSGPSDTDARGFNYDLDSVASRLKKGHNVIMYDYLLPKTTSAFVRVDEKYFYWKRAGKSQKRIPLELIRGVLFGSKSSTFMRYCRDPAVTELYDEFTGASIVSVYRTFDFVLLSALARYDICIGMSWMALAKFPLSSMVPLTKCKIQVVNITLQLIKSKIRAEAEHRLITVNELFIVNSIQLGLLKTAYNLKMKDRVVKLKTFIDKRFRNVSVFYRLVLNIKKLIGVKVSPEKNSEFVRVNLLNGKKIRKLALGDKVDAQFKKLAVGKGNSLKAYLVPNLAGLLYEKFFNERSNKKNATIEFRDRIRGSTLLHKQDLPAQSAETDDGILFR